MLLSYINTQLRDFYPSLDELCRGWTSTATRLSTSCTRPVSTT